MKALVESELSYLVGARLMKAISVILFTCLSKYRGFGCAQCDLTKLQKTCSVAMDVY